VGGTHNSEARKQMRARNDQVRRSKVWVSLPALLSRTLELMSRRRRWVQRNMDYYIEHYRAHFPNITARIRRR
jgi:hypothetical protein